MKQMISSSAWPAKAALLIAPLFVVVGAFAETPAPAAKVYGKIQIVNAFPDYKVRVVNSFPDLKVQVVKAFPNAPGKWQLVKHFPDFKVQIVSSGEDFTIQYVTAFPGPR